MPAHTDKDALIVVLLPFNYPNYPPKKASICMDKVTDGEIIIYLKPQEYTRDGSSTPNMLSA